MKLQDAYVAERNALGVWVDIGYVSPTGSNFTYKGGTTNPTNTCTEGTLVTADGAHKGDCKISEEGKDDKFVSPSGSTITDGWIAANIAKLNDCAAGDNWKISGTTNSTSGAAAVTYEPTIVGEGCGSLTPNFDKIGK